ncbi:MAG: RNA-binding protein [Alphaproteobacteria bacterium]
MIAAAEADTVEPDDNFGKGDPCRRCIVTTAIRPREELIRFVVAPDGRVTPDLDESLPGRGLWVGCDAQTLNEAARKNLFSKAARRKVTCPADLAIEVAGLLRSRLLQLLGLARRSGLVVTGFPQVEAAVVKGDIALLLIAADAGEDGPSKLRHKISPDRIWRILSSQELGRALGHEQLVYIGLKPQALTGKIAATSRRFSGFIGPENQGTPRNPQEPIASEPGLAHIAPIMDRSGS